MPFLITVIEPNGESVKFEYKNAPPLSMLRAWVGDGYIETVPYFTRHDGKRAVAFCNEEGKLDGLEYNPKAQLLWEAEQSRHIGIKIDDHLVGPIVIVTVDTDAEYEEL
jgi:hypothetical protein